MKVLENLVRTIGKSPHIEVRYGDRAATDGLYVNLILPQEIEKTMEVGPRVALSLAKYFAIHEAAHLLYSDIPGITNHMASQIASRASVRDPLWFRCLNILEDYRVDSLLFHDYPELQSTTARARQRLCDRHIQIMDNRKPSLLLLALYKAEGMKLPAQWSRIKWVEGVEAVIRKAHRVEQEVVYELVEELYGACGQVTKIRGGYL